VCHFFFFQFVTLIPGPLGPKKGWTHKNTGVHMHDGVLPNGQPQSFYFPPKPHPMPGWFKGMEVIICKNRLWPEKGLPAQCLDFKCPPNCMDCCCWRLLYFQPDFVGQKSQLKELIELCGHICDFYPKYHCELNFIEQYWGAAKSRYCIVP
jgi:hypothetical protein